MERQNPYVILGVSENATKKEILAALKYKISIFCDSDGNGKDVNGDYYQQLFYENAQMLLDSEKRKEIDEYLMSIRSKNGLTIYKPKTTNEFITYINELVFTDENISKLKVSNNDDPDCNRKEYLEKRFALIGEDASFMFAWEKVNMVDGFFFGNVNYYYLEDSFTYQILTEKEYRYNEIPWMNGKPFDVCGVKTLAVPASKLIPVDLIKNDVRPYISLYSLKLLQKAVVNAINRRPEVVESIFEKYKNDNSYKLLGKRINI